METGLLYSGGKDSTLAALLLEEFCDITLCCCTFGVTDDYGHAVRAGDAVGFETERIELDPAVARGAVEEIVDDGYPRNGIQTVHEHAIQRVAERGYEAVADGTRRDDRVPTVPRSLAQSVEDRYGVSHLAPLAGFGRAAIDELAADHLVVETGPSEDLEKGDYESELRALIAREYGDDSVGEIFPEHTQSRVTGRRSR